MPKPTFFNLAAEKQEKIMAAAKKEFSRAPLHEASIANIVKHAEIPRGSFYQYFEDKEDLFLFILMEFRKTTVNTLKNALQDTGGDIIQTFIRFLQSWLQSLDIQENIDFFRNAFINMNYKMGTALGPGFDQNSVHKELTELAGLIDISKLNIADPREVPLVLHLMMTITMQSMIENFAKKLSPEVTLAMYQQQLNLLKNGIYKKGE